MSCILRFALSVPFLPGAAAALALVLAILPPAAAARADAPAIPIGLLVQHQARPPGLANLDVPPEDEGLPGARLAIDDNNTTGRFTGQTFALQAELLAQDADPVAAFRRMRQAASRCHTRRSKAPKPTSGLMCGPAVLSPQAASTAASAAATMSRSVRW